MRLKIGPAILLCLFLATSLLATVFADISVGVKEGDWVEYDVTFTGNPPVEHDAVWARMEVVSVEGERINATFVSELSNGTTLSVVEDLNFESGRLIDLFIIPAGMAVGENFYDDLVGQVVIDRIEERTYAGASRSVMHAEAVETQWYWDVTTGIVVEAETSSSMYTLDTVAKRTNLWEAQILGLDSFAFYAFVTIAVVVAIALAIFLIARRKHTVVA